MFEDVWKSFPKMHCIWNLGIAPGTTNLRLMGIQEDPPLPNAIPPQEIKQYERIIKHHDPFIRS